MSRPAPSGIQAGTEATRYLAAAAYRDRLFRQKVLEYFRHRWYRAAAPEFGIDDRLIHKHCQRADTREFVRNVFMMLLFLVLAVLPLPWVLSSYQDMQEYLSNNSINILLALVPPAFILFAERLYIEHFLLVRQFGRDRFVNSGGSILSDIESQNLIVYGGYAPFVGSGYWLGGWSFSVNFERTKEELSHAAKAQPFETRSLLLYVRQRLDRLRNNNLRYREVLFADGRLLRENGSRLMHEGRPRRRISADDIEQLSDSAAAGTRSYLCIHIADWGGELVISIYLRCKKHESGLFVEASYYVLPPPKRNFFKIDEEDLELRPGAILRLAVETCVATPFVIALAAMQIPARLIAPLSHWLERRRIRKAIRCNPRFNFGAFTSIRELGMEDYFRVYFQRLDRDRHVKTVEQCAIDAIIEFLDAHDIDTSDLRDRRSAVLNNGVIVSGGDFNAQNVAVGAHARAAMAGIGAKMGIGGSSPRKPQPKGRA